MAGDFVHKTDTKIPSKILEALSSSSQKDNLPTSIWVYLGKECKN